jgi:hypothetical protein
MDKPDLHMPDATAGEHVPPHAQTGLGQDMLKGAGEIGAFMGLSPRKVYRLYDLNKQGESDIPIAKIRGLGLAASRKQLQVWLRQHLNTFSA